MYNILCTTIELHCLHVRICTVLVSRECSARVFNELYVQRAVSSACSAGVFIAMYSKCTYVFCTVVIQSWGSIASSFC